MADKSLTCDTDMLNSIAAVDYLIGAMDSIANSWAELGRPDTQDLAKVLGTTATQKITLLSPALPPELQKEMVARTELVSNDIQNFLDGADRTLIRERLRLVLTSVKYDLLLAALSHYDSCQSGNHG